MAPPFKSLTEAKQFASYPAKNRLEAIFVVRDEGLEPPTFSV